MLGNKLSPQNKNCIISEVTQFIGIRDDSNLNLGKIIDLIHLDDHSEIRSCWIRTKNFESIYPTYNLRYLERYTGEVSPLSPISNNVPIQAVTAGKRLVGHHQVFFPSEPEEESTLRQWATSSGVQPDVIQNQILPNLSL